METTTSVKIEYASFWARLGATLIDGIILIIAQSAVYYGIFFSIGFGDANETALQFYQQMIGLAFGFIYFITQETGAKQATLGKQVLNIKVTDSYGDKISASTSFIRYLMKNLLLVIPIVYAFAMNMDITPDPSNPNPFMGENATYFIFSSAFSVLGLIGYLLATFTARRQALHDFVAGTVVLKQSNLFASDNNEEF